MYVCVLLPFFLVFAASFPLFLVRLCFPLLAGGHHSSIEQEGASTTKRLACIYLAAICWIVVKVV
jgi:hypothetical protein